jgi:hypothetical protein
MGQFIPAGWADLWELIFFLHLKKCVHLTAYTVSMDLGIKSIQKTKSLFFPIKKEYSLRSKKP